MPATAPRAAALVLALFPLAWAAGDPHAEVVDLFASMSAALTEDPPNAAGFMKAFDRDMPNYGELSRGVKALLLDSWVESSIEFLKDEGGGAKRSAELDWYMLRRGKQEGGPTRQNRMVVHCELEKQGKHWRITSISPISLFEP